MKRTYKAIPLAVVLLLIAGVAAAVDVELKVGAEADVIGLTIGFESVPSEGRCAIGVFCFWEGDAACNLWVQARGSERKQVVVHTSSHFGQQVEYEGYTIRLVKLDPYPIHERPTPPDSYVVTLSVTHAVITATEESTWSRIKALYQ